MQDERSVVLFVVDGLRPDALPLAATPTLDALIAQGAHTSRARTVMPSATLPCHTSLLLGVGPDRHGITTNTWAPPVRPVPGIVDVAHRAGKKTASFYNWEPLRDLSAPGSLDRACFVRNCHEPGGDLDLAELAAEHLRQAAVGFTFVYFGHTDVKGHDSGWMSDAYLDAVSKADRAIGIVLDGLRQSGRLDRTVCVVTSDHGGHGRTHGTEMDEDMIIPCILSGPGVRRVGLRDPVQITDIAPTTAAVLGLAAPPDWVGRAIVEAFDGAGASLPSESAVT
jgi:predicted AlkP superfamily pyrophosphatase or phosphodiesterase